MARPSTSDLRPPLATPLLDENGKLSKGWMQFFQRELSLKFWSAAPSSAAAAGSPGQIAFDSGFLYICVAQNSWKRVAIASW